MSIHSIFGRNVIWWDERSRSKYWSKISEYLLTKYPTIDNLKEEEIVQAFKEGFSYCISEFERLLIDETNIAFYVFVFGYHETSIEIWERQLQRQSIEPFLEQDFATYRRSLKLILEQACKRDLIVGEDLRIDIVNNLAEYKELLEDLLYLGMWLYSFAEYVAHMDLMGPIHGFRIEGDGSISVLTVGPFSQLMQNMTKDYRNHTSEVVLDNMSIKELKSALIDSLGIDFDKAASFITDQKENQEMKYGLYSVDSIVESVSQNFSYSKEAVADFFNGLTLRKENVLPTAQSVLSPQMHQRYAYRPILQLHCVLGKVAIIGINKWRESLATYATNSLPWGFAPDEWMKYEEFQQFANNKSSRNDALLEDKVETFLKDQHLCYERNITSFKASDTNSVSCNVAGVGEMDFVVLDTANNRVWILECKHNRARYDAVSWRKEFSNFTKTYEPKLKGKLEWLRNHLDVLVAHFGLVHGITINPNEWEIESAFVVNAPTFYLYNGNMHCFTLTTLKSLTNAKIVSVTWPLKFTTKSGDEEFAIARPYFANAFHQSEKLAEMDS